MPIDKFGRYVNRSRGGSGDVIRQQQQRYLFPLTSTGGFDLEGRRLSNVGDPTQSQDVVTNNVVEVLENRISHFEKKITTLVDDAILFNGTVYNVNNRLLSNLAHPINDNDAVTLKYYRDNINPKIDNDLKALELKYNEGIEKLNEFQRVLKVERKEYSNLLKRTVDDAIKPLTVRIEQLEHLNKKVARLEEYFKQLRVQNP